MSSCIFDVSFSPKLFSPISQSVAEALKLNFPCIILVVSNVVIWKIGQEQFVCLLLVQGGCQIPAAIKISIQ